MIEAEDIFGVDELTALRILAVARTIAPCLDSLTDPERGSAIAVLTGVAREAASRGSRLVKGQRIGPAGVDYNDAASWFWPDDKAALRALCGAVPPAGLPRGSFPRGGIVGRLWPGEDC